MQVLFVFHPERDSPGSYSLIDGGLLKTSVFGT